MVSFQSLDHTDDLKKILHTAFDSDLPVSGSWGYTQEDATVIKPSDIPLNQIQHVFASMRAYVEMNMTLPEEERYGSINVNEQKREALVVDGKSYQKVSYEITAMKESLYKQFIKEYKEGYGKASFDLNAHFNQRKEATLTREVTHWFEIN